MELMTSAGETIEKRVRGIGRAQRSRHEYFTMPNLAMMVAEAAKAGEVDEDSASEIYETYIKESTGLKPIRANPSFRTNCSKLRQIIRAKSPTLLKRVAKIHEANRGERIRPLYPAMVDVCRLAQSQTKSPTDAQILKIVRQKRYDYK